MPVDAVVNEGDKDYVWVYDKDSQKASKVEVALGSADAKQQEILSGLEVGQIVISNPDSSLKEWRKKFLMLLLMIQPLTEESEVSE